MLELALDYYNQHDEALTYEITLTADNSEETQTIRFETELPETIEVTGEDGNKSKEESFSIKQI